MDHLPETQLRDRSQRPDERGYRSVLEGGKVGEGGRDPETTGLLLRRYARGTFPRGRVQALDLDTLSAPRWGKADGGSMVEVPGGK